MSQLSQYDQQLKKAIKLRRKMSNKDLYLAKEEKAMANLGMTEQKNKIHKVHKRRNACLGTKRKLTDKKNSYLQNFSDENKLADAAASPESKAYTERHSEEQRNFRPKLEQYSADLLAEAKALGLI